MLWNETMTQVMEKRIRPTSRPSHAQAMCSIRNSPYTVSLEYREMLQRGSHRLALYACEKTTVQTWFNRYRRNTDSSRRILRNLNGNFGFVDLAEHDEGGG